MIKIFFDFCQFSAKKLGVFLKKTMLDQIFAKSSSSLSKLRPLFLPNFTAKIFQKS
jgi:hypothetical protein